MARELLAIHRDAETRFERGAVHASASGVKHAQIIPRAGAEVGANVGVGVS